MGKSATTLANRSTTSPYEFTDADLLHKMACVERRALACAVELDNEVSVAGCYLLSGVIGEELDGLIDDLVQKLGLANGDDVFMNVTPIMLTAVWMGLTLAHVRMGDSVHMPYRLFPELSSSI